MWPTACDLGRSHAGLRAGDAPAPAFAPRAERGRGERSAAARLRHGRGTVVSARPACYYFSLFFKSVAGTPRRHGRK